MDPNYYKSSHPQPYISLAQGTYSNDSIMGHPDFYSMNNGGFGWGHPLTSSTGFYNPFNNSGYNSPKQMEHVFPNDRFKPPMKTETRRGESYAYSGFLD
jgi:hypothetical protein